MRMAAKITILDRSPRRDVALPATLRRGGVPTDIEIVDLSTSGFRAMSETNLEVGSEVRVGWAGGGLHDAVVARKNVDEYGFVFARELSQSAYDEANRLNNVLRFDGEPWRSVSVAAGDVPKPHVDRWRPRNRLMFIALAACGSWGVIGVAGWLIARLFR